MIVQELEEKAARGCYGDNNLASTEKTTGGHHVRGSSSIHSFAPHQRGLESETCLCRVGS